MSAGLAFIPASVEIAKALPCVTSTIQNLGASAFSAINGTLPLVETVTPYLATLGQVMLPAGAVLTGVLVARDWKRANSEKVAGHIGNLTGSIIGGAVTGFTTSVYLGTPAGPSMLVLGALGALAGGIFGERTAKAFLADRVENVMTSVNSLDLRTNLSVKRAAFLQKAFETVSPVRARRRHYASLLISPKKERDIEADRPPTPSIKSHNDGIKM